MLAFIRHHPNLEAIPTDLQMAQEAAGLRAAFGFRPPDALIIGTAIACQVGMVATNDHEWATKLQPLRGRLGVVTLSRFL